MAGPRPPARGGPRGGPEPGDLRQDPAPGSPTQALLSGSLPKEEVVDDEQSRTVRDGLCLALVGAFRSVGQALWVGGYIIGGDRAAGLSPFGSDAAVGLATVTQIAGQLSAGVMSLLDAGNTYAAAALVRQLVEVEYLAWAFAEDEAEAAAWLRSSAQDRLRMWQPRHLRDRSSGRFRGVDYARHCERGGHPTPAAMAILPDHRQGIPPWFWRLDLAVHAASTWAYVHTAADRPGYGQLARGAAASHGVDDALHHWRDGDKLREIGTRWLSDRRITT